MVNLKMLTIQVTGMFVVIGLAMFLAAGTVAWAAGWAFLILFFVFTVALSRWLLSHNPDLLNERLTGMSNPNRKTWDKVLYPILNLIFLAWLVFMPLDAVRFHWSHVPGWLQVVGALLLVGSFYLFYLTFRENAFLSPAVRLQTERGQAVISSGPYHFVRHPMYATAVIFFVGATLLMGSLLGLLVALVLFIAIAYRAVQEERTLREELPGYDAYMEKVHYRLIPYVW